MFLIHLRNKTRHPNHTSMRSIKQHTVPDTLSMPIDSSKQAAVITRVSELVAEGNFKDIIPLLKQIPKEQHAEIAQQMLDAKQYFLGEENFKDIPDEKQIVARLRESDPVWVLIENLDKFSDVNHYEICKTVIHLPDELSPQAISVALNLDKFGQDLKQKLLSEYIATNKTNHLVETIIHSKLENYNEILNIIIEHKPTEYDRVVYGIENFDAETKKSLVSHLINNGLYSRLSYNLESLTEQQQSTLIDAVFKTESLANNNEISSSQNIIIQDIDKLKNKALLSFTNQAIKKNNLTYLSKIGKTESKIATRTVLKLIRYNSRFKKSLSLDFYSPSGSINFRELFNQVPEQDRLRVAKEYFKRNLGSTCLHLVEKLPESDRKEYINTVIKAIRKAPRMGTNYREISGTIVHLPEGIRKKYTLKLFTCLYDRHKKLDFDSYTAHYLLKPLAPEDKKSIYLLYLKNSKTSKKEVDVISQLKDVPEKDRKDIVSFLLKRASSPEERSTYISEGIKKAVISIQDRASLLCEYLDLHKTPTTISIQFLKDSIKECSVDDKISVLDKLIERQEKFYNKDHPVENLISSNECLNSDQFLSSFIKECNSEQAKENISKIIESYKRSHYHKSEKLPLLLAKSEIDVTDLNHLVNSLSDLPSTLVSFIKHNQTAGLNLDKKLLVQIIKSENDSLSEQQINNVFNISEERKKAEKLGFSISSYLILEEHITTDKPTEEDYKKFLDILCSNHPNWRDQENIVKPFTEAAELLGYKFMFDFVSRKDINLHNACFALRSIITLPEQFGIIEREEKIPALRRLLSEVKRDTATINNGSSYDKLNTIAQSKITNPNDFLESIKNDPLLREDQDTLRSAQEFSNDSKNICYSWRKLNKYADYTNFFLKNKKVVEQIVLLKQKGEHRKADFFNKIANNQGSDVNLHALVEFITKPDIFLSRSDAHADQKLHSKKKPSNYIEIPNLGLTADNLLNGLVNGALDKIQVIAPAAIEYKFAEQGKILNEDLEKLALKDLIKQVLGSRKNNIPSLLTETNFKKSFQQLQAKVNEKSTSGKIKFVEEFLNGNHSVDDETESELRSIVRSFVELEDKIDSHGQRFLVKIHPKSSPEAVVAGDDTKCCMAFGSGKNNVYMFNPNCTQLTIQVLNNDGIPQRTVAQSVVTVNLDAHKPVPQILEEVNKNTPFHEIIPEEFVNNSSRYLVCDSVETNANFVANSNNVQLIKLMYEDFFKSILKQLPEQILAGHTLDKTKVFIPNGHFQGPFARVYSTEPNRYVPLAPMSYSDNKGQEVKVLIPTDHNLTKEVHGKTEITANLQERGKTSELTFMDTLHVAYLEGKIYQETTLSESLHNIQNGIIAKDIANSIRGNPNLSLKYLSSDGTMQGYLIAYEGVHDETKESCIYIGDFASKKRNSVEAGKLLLAFMDKYKENYIDKKNLLPIYMEARDETSYRLLQRQLEKMSTRLGCKFSVQELSTEQKGKDFMHNLKVTCVMD